MDGWMDRPTPNPPRPHPPPTHLGQRQEAPLKEPLPKAEAAAQVEQALAAKALGGCWGVWGGGFGGETRKRGGWVEKKEPWKVVSFLFGGER